MSTITGRPVRIVWQFEVKPGQMQTFLDSIVANRPMAERLWGGAAQILRTAIGGPQTGSVVLVTDFANMADFAERSDRAQTDEEWIAFSAWINGPDSPAVSQSLMLMLDITP